MKTILFFLMAIFATHSTFAQKSKNKTPAHRHYKTNAANYVCPQHADVSSKTPGKCSKCNMDLTLSKKEQMKRGVVKIYTCPMHAEVVSDKPGKCPMCNMDLAASKKEQMKKDVIKLYACPMHPEEQADNAGKCPKCGMDMTKMKHNDPSKEN